MVAHFARGHSVGHFSRRLLLALGVSLFVVTGLANSLGIPIARADWLSPAELLNPDGSLNLTTDKAGSVDVRGWNAHLDPQRGPVLAPNAPNAAAWSALDNGLKSIVYALAISGSNVYVGGAFTQVCGSPACTTGNTTVNYIAKWNGSTWSALANGVNGAVFALAVSGSNVYVGGEFTVVCGSPACSTSNTTVNHIAKWNGSTWSALANGVDSTVFALAVSGSDVYVGGGFTQVCGNSRCNSGNTTVNHIAKWNGSTWSALANGVNGVVYALAISGSNVYVGGNFTQVCGSPACPTGNTNVNHIAKWNGSTWFDLAYGVNGGVDALAVSGSNLYVGGSFTEVCGFACSVGNSRVNHIAKWNGSTWSALAFGVDGLVEALAVSGSDVYVGGGFAQLCGVSTCNSGNTTVQYIAKWNGSSWSALNNGLNSSVSALAASGSDIFAGGSFTQACGNATCNDNNLLVLRVAKYGAPPATPTPTRTPTKTPTKTPTRTPTNSCNTKPAKPTLTAPANGAVVSKPKAALAWSNVACETKYKVRVKNAATNLTAYKANLGADVVQIKTTPLAHAVTYKWFVKACNSFGCTKSVVETFHVP